VSSTCVERNEEETWVCRAVGRAWLLKKDRELSNFEQLPSATVTKIREEDERSHHRDILAIRCPLWRSPESFCD